MENAFLIRFASAGACALAFVAGIALASPQVSLGVKYFIVLLSGVWVAVSLWVIWLCTEKTQQQIEELQER